MATITIRLSTKVEPKSQKAEVLIRFRHGPIDIYAKSRVWVKDKFWSTNKIVVPNVRIVTNEIQDIREANDKLSEIINLISTNFINADRGVIDKEWVNNIIELYHNPSSHNTEEVFDITFFDAFNEFLTHSKFSDIRIRGYHVLRRALLRFEMYKRFRLSLDTFNTPMLRDFEHYIKQEHLILQESKYSHIYKSVPGSNRRPKQRGHNTITALLNQLRAFFNWCANQEYINKTPFKGFEVKDEIYGTPYYITIEERNKIYKTNLCRHSQLAIQRDIFVFQCLIGCRVSDLIKLTKNSLINVTIRNKTSCII